MKIIGITGTSGAGKTTLSQIINKRNDTIIIDADKVVKKLSLPGNEYLNSIKNTFGENVLLEDGNLNRKLLAKRIYTDKSDREKLNSITFDHVVKEIKDIIKNIHDEKIKIVVIDAPLLFESELDKQCDIIISLVADEVLKIKRICQRDNIDEETAKSRLKIQHNDSFYIEKSNYVIKNNEDCNLEMEIEKIYKKILE